MRTAFGAEGAVQGIEAVTADRHVTGCVSGGQRREGWQDLFALRRLS